MLIVAIPKSGSTALMATLGSLHKIEAKQNFSFSENKIPASSHFIHKNHSDIRELNPQVVSKFNEQNRLYKQHVFPSENNLNLLRKTKKVVLLRKPKEVVKAYRRGAQKKIHNKLEGFPRDASEKEWIDKADDVGLLDDLKIFHEKWKAEAESKNTLLIQYEELVDKPTETINKIEEFYELPVHDNVKLKKKRYSRRPPVSNFIVISINRVKKSSAKFLKRTGMLKLIKS